jgi:Ca2+-binding EF-hand superfamily protein
MKKFLIGGAAAAVLLVSGTALATPTTTTTRTARHARSAHPVTRAEAQSRIAAVFAKLDTNHDGSITKDELSAVEAQHEQKAEERAQHFDPSKVFDRLDADHDGKITVAEAGASRGKRAQTTQAQASAFHGLFARADTNKDNVLTRAEFDAMGQQLKARMQHASVVRAGTAVRMFDTEDANRDGRVTLAEMQQAALARFDRVDLNHDGTITPEERQQARHLSRAKRSKASAGN